MVSPFQPGRREGVVLLGAAIDLWRGRGDDLFLWGRRDCVLFRRSVLLYGIKKGEKKRGGGGWHFLLFKEMEFFYWEREVGKRDHNNNWGKRKRQELLPAS